MCFKSIKANGYALVKAQGLQGIPTVITADPLNYKIILPCHFRHETPY